jgi:hypothetical protein
MAATASAMRGVVAVFPSTKFARRAKMMPRTSRSGRGLPKEVVAAKGFSRA